MVAVAETKDDVLSSKSTNKAVSKIKKLKSKKDIEESKSRGGIIMLSHIPHGFYEKQMSGFFKQFGKVRKVKVARSKKTGKSKGYGFVEFEFEEVARIAAETMDNYLMFERLLKCKLLGPEANPKKIFSGSYIRLNNCPTLKNREKMKDKQDIPKSPEQQEVAQNNRLLKLKEHNSKLSKLDINYEFTPLGINLDNVQRQEKKKKEETGDKNKDTNGKTVGKNAKNTTPTRKRKNSATKDSPKANNTDDGKDEQQLVIEKVPTPKKLKSASSSPALVNVELNKTPKNQKKDANLAGRNNTPKKSPAINSQKTPQQQVESQTNNASESNKTNDKKQAKTPEMKKTNFSPKLLRSRASLKPQTPAGNENQGTKKQKVVKTPVPIENKTPKKISPKLLRSRKSMKPEVETPTTTATITPKKKNVINNTNNSKDKTPEMKKTKFSPKLLRSSIKKKI